MSALAASFAARLRDPLALRRGLVAGIAWGLAFTAGLIALAAWQCGSVCIDEALWIATLAIPTGILTIGPTTFLGGAQPRDRGCRIHQAT